MKRIYDLDRCLCYTCCRTLIFLARSHEIKSVHVQCHICGMRRRPALFHEPICRTCLLARARGLAECVACHQPRVIYNLRTHTCKQCYNDVRAPDTLRRYLANFHTAYPANRRLFDLFAATIDWSTIDKFIYRRVRYFGRFLQTTPFDEPLTWDALERAMPPLSATNRNIPKQIRASLLTVGHLLAARGDLESREHYLDRKNAVAVLERSPTKLLPLLQRYVDWLWGRDTVPANIRDHCEALTAFWTWAVARGFDTPAAVQIELMNDYLLTLYWHWRCAACHAAQPFDPAQRNPPISCPQCHALHAFEQVTRYVQNTVRAQRAKLFVFFEWAQANRLILINPMQRKIPAPIATIHHYDVDVIRQLCVYISSPTADPRDALMLYLILFHGLSVWELCHAQIPTVATLDGAITGLALAEAFYIIVPRPAPSRGDHAPGRPSSRLDFPAAASPWLAPLLERYEAQRLQHLQHRRNDYLFATPLRHNVPISRSWINSIVMQATQRLLGGSCNPNTLRKTCALQLSERGGGAILCELGWESMQAFVYMWAPRIVVTPRHSARTARRTPRTATSGTSSAPPIAEQPIVREDKFGETRGLDTQDAEVTLPQENLYFPPPPESSETMDDR